MATQPKKGKCNACGERILWVKTTKGNNMAVDIDPQICEFRVPGEFYKTEEGEPTKSVIVFRGKLGVVLNENEPFTAHRCHFDTCTAKGDWKGKAKKPIAGNSSRSRW
jgi:hypothetical protein